MRALKTFLLLIALGLLVLGCSSAANVAPGTLVPTAAGSAGADDTTDDESPRTDGEGPSARIPATWTPAPTVEAPPAPTVSTPAPDETYVVRAGDTLAEIAEAHGVDLQQLARANDIQNIDTILVGQVLVIPR